MMPTDTPPVAPTDTPTDTLTDMPTDTLTDMPPLAPHRPDLPQALAHAALDAADAMVVITDTNGIIRYVNRAFTQATGYAFDEAVGATPRVLRSGEHDQAFYERLWSTVLGGEVWEGEIINRRRTGELYTDRMTISPVRDAAGQVTHMVAIKRDVSARVDDLLAASPYGVLHLGADASLVYANDRACELLGAAFTELLGAGWRHVIGADDTDALVTAVTDASRLGQVRAPDRVRIITVGARHLRVHLGVLRPGQDTVLGCVVALEDATAEVVATAALEDRERFARTVLDAIDSPTAVVDGAGVIVQVNRAWADGPPGDPLLGRAPGTDLLALADDRTDGSLARVVTAIRAAIGSVASAPRLVEHRSPGTRARWWQVRVTHLPISAGGAVVTASDVTAIRRAQQRSAVDARTDALTGLRNRRGLDEGLAALPTGSPIAVLFCDLDGFKPINDVHGHAVGDDLLRAVAGRLTGEVRDGDLVARIGGDEFALVLPGASEATAHAVADRVEAAVSRTFHLEDGVEVTVGISVGLVADDGGRDPADLLAGADQAMYAVKRARQPVAG